MANETISNSTPLITLCKIAGLPLLEALFGKVSIPRAVYQETVEDKNAPERQTGMIREAIARGYIRVASISTKRPLRRKLGSGEGEALTLALERHPAHLIIDDKSARKEAIDQGLGDILINTSTVLKMAEERGWIDYEWAIQSLKREGEILSEEE